MAGGVWPNSGSISDPSRPYSPLMALPTVALANTRNRAYMVAAALLLFAVSALLVGQLQSFVLTLPKGMAHDNDSSSAMASLTHSAGQDYLDEAALPPRLYLWDLTELEAMRDKYRSGTADSNTVKSIEYIRKELDPLVAKKTTYSVTGQQTPPPSNDKHDYQSMGYYWWPCHEALKVCQKEVPLLYNQPCNVTTGLPWVNCDGFQNKRTKEYSAKMELADMGTQVSELALLYWYTGEDKYAEHAARLARVFFLDPATRMNPHLKYAQTVPGLEDFDSVIGYGIIEALQLSEVLEGLALLRIAKSPYWNDDRDHALLMDWMRRLLRWLMTSAHGNLERHRDNNHGIWFHQTALSIALHVGDEDIAIALANDLPWYILDRQITTEGKMPAELDRPRPIHYTCYAMTAALRTGRMAKAVNVDVSQHLDSNPDSDARVNHLKKAVEYVVPFASLSKPFVYDDHDKENQDRHDAGSPWYRCSEALAMARREWATDSQFVMGVDKALKANRDTMWHPFNEARIYGVPTPLVYDPRLQ